MFLKYLIDNIISIITFIFLLSFLFFLFFPHFITITPLPSVYLYTKLVIFKVFSLPSAYFVLLWGHNHFSGHLSRSQPRSRNFHFPSLLTFTMRMKAPFYSETPVFTDWTKICYILQSRYPYIHSRENKQSLSCQKHVENIANDSENDPPKDDAHVFFQKCSQIIWQRGWGEML